jgi:hypothetical protein
MLLRPRVPPFPRSSDASVWQKRCGCASFTPASLKTADIVCHEPFTRLRSVAVSFAKYRRSCSAAAFGVGNISSASITEFGNSTRTIRWFLIARFSSRVPKMWSHDNVITSLIRKPA